MASGILLLMARPLRIEYPGAVYHITARGNAQQDIFLDESDYLEMLNVLCWVVKRFNWLLHAYCLMGNHYHLLIETPDGNLSAGMRQLNGVYTQRFNRRHSRAGHVMQGRYKSILVEKETYLLELSRYIVLNPVRAVMVKKPEQWRWSSYRKTAGTGEGVSCLTVEWQLNLFARTRRTAQEKYKDFVDAGKGAQSPMEKLTGQALLGEEGFIEKMKPLLADKENIQEIPRRQRYLGRPSIEKLLKKGLRGDPAAEAAYRAHVEYGYTLKEIGQGLGLHYTTISVMIKEIEGRG
jgi:REP element-mobilizing transposase RayT